MEKIHEERLEGVSKPIFYTGIEASGGLHIGHLASFVRGVSDARSYGAPVFYLITTFHASLNNKENLAENALKLEAQIRDLNLFEETRDRIVFSDQIVSKEYLLEGLGIAAKIDRKRLLKATTITGRAFEGETSCLLPLYPIYQCMDPHYLGVSAYFAGSDQRSCAALALDFPKFFRPITYFFYPLLPSLDFSGKMSKSKGITIFLEDSPEKILRKIMKAELNPKLFSESPLFEFWNGVRALSGLKEIGSEEVDQLLVDLGPAGVKRLISEDTCLFVGSQVRSFQ